MRIFARSLARTMQGQQPPKIKLLRDRLQVWLSRRSPDLILRLAEEWAARLLDARAGL
jgi:hypothetical protein